MGYQPGYIERRTRHAIAVDRGIQAKTVYSGFAQGYKQAPNASDVEGYDTRYRPEPGTPMPKPKAKREKDYEPTTGEMKRLKAIFHKQSLPDQYVDLQHSRNVAKSKREVKEWKKNPAKADVQGVDTRPKSLMESRYKAVKKHLPGVDIQFKGTPRNAWGAFQYHPTLPNKPGTIHIKKKLMGTEKFDEVLSHELGHAYDRNVIGKRKPILGGRLGTDNVNLTDKQRDELFEVNTKLINPYDANSSNWKYRVYRDRPEEQFANWFSGMITQPKKTKDMSADFFKGFGKSNTKLFEDLSTVDKQELGPFMSKKGFSIFGGL